MNNNSKIMVLDQFISILRFVKNGSYNFMFVLPPEGVFTHITAELT